MSLGIHSKLDGFDTSLIDALGRSNMSIFVGVSNSGRLPVMAQVRSLTGDKCLFVYRLYNFDMESGGKWPAMKPSTPPAQAAKIWFDDIVASGAHNFPWIYWQGLNEPKGDYAWLGAFDAERIRLCKAAGLRAAICCFAMGNPEPQDWLEYIEALQACHDAGPGTAILILHVYWPKADDPYFEAQYFLTRDLVLVQFLSAHGLTNVQRHYTEFGANTKGYRAWPGMTNQQYVALLQQADAASPGVRKAVYDCSNIPDDRNQSHDFSIQDAFGPRGEQTRAVDLLIPVLNAQVVAPAPGIPPNPTPNPNPTPPPPPPPVSDWQRVAISNDGFEGATYIEADDVFGMRRIPEGWNLDWKTTQLSPHAELEAHPTHVAEGRFSARAYGPGQWEAWYWRIIKVPAHCTVRLKARSLGTATDVVDAPSRAGDKIMRWIGIDASGGTAESDRTPPADPALKWTEAITGMDLYDRQILEAQTQGDTATLLLRARHTGSTLRADVFWDDVIVEVLPLSGQTPPPLTFPFRVEVNTTASYIYMRSEPNSASEANKVGQVFVGKAVWVDGVSEDGKWWKLRGQDVYISRQLTKVI